MPAPLVAPSGSAPAHTLGVPGQGVRIVLGKSAGSLAAVDVDGFIIANRPSWDRLDALAGLARGRRARLSSDELDELLARYQEAATHLSVARTRFGDPQLTQELSRRVGRAATIVHGTKSATWRQALGFVTDTFPAAMWHIRRHIVVATLALMVPWLVIGAWLGQSPAAQEAIGPEAVRTAYVEEEFEAYYTDPASAEFAAFVTTNNIRVGVLAFALGVLLCLPTLAVLVLNGANVGVALGLFIAAGQQGRFWGLILPHGMLELTAIFIAGAAGLAMGWAIIDPGDRPRTQALADASRRSITIVIGLFGVFLIAGLIEGYVSGAPLSTPVRVTIGATAWALFVAYAWWRGRDAAARGLTGAIGEQARPRAGALTAAPTP